MAKGNEIETPSLNLVGTGTVIKGDIITNGDIRIDGSLHGTLKSNGKLIVGATGQIDGEISCKNADFSGVIKAQVSVTEVLSLKSTAKLTGDITISKLLVEPGAIFTGFCSMSGVDAKEMIKERETKNGTEKPEGIQIKKPTIELR